MSHLYFLKLNCNILIVRMLQIFQYLTCFFPEKSQFNQKTRKSESSSFKFPSYQSVLDEKSKPFLVAKGLDLLFLGYFFLNGHGVIQ